MRYFGGDDKRIIDGLIRCVDLKLNLGPGELPWVFAFHGPGGPLPAFLARPDFFAVNHLAPDLGSFYRYAKCTGSSALDCADIDAGKEGNLLVGESEPEKLSDGFLDGLGYGFRAAGRHTDFSDLRGAQESQHQNIDETNVMLECEQSRLP